MKEAVAVRIGAREVTRRFGAVVANDHVDLSVAPRTIHAVVGGNGAGKSTLMRILQGVDAPDTGAVILDDRPVRLEGPADAFARGVGLVHQEFMLAPPLSLLENLILAREPTMLGGLIDWRRAEAEAEEVAALAGVTVDWRLKAVDAPIHMRQSLEILRLLYRGADVLILDEPTAVLAPPQIEDLLALMHRLKAEGRTIVFISHKLDEVMNVADAITVMRSGRVVTTTTPSTTSVADLATAMVGEAVGVPQLETRPRPRGEPLFRARSLVGVDTLGFKRLGPVDLDVFRGEIVGVAGVGGNGQDELVACAAGLAHPVEGTIAFGGRNLAGLPASRFRETGIGYVSADRAGEGLCLTASVRENFAAGREREPVFSRFGLLRRAAIDAEARKALARLNVRFGSLGDPAGSLSGGNQQRLAIARELEREPKLLVAAQPTRGVDIAGTAFIHRLLAAFRDRGGAVLLVSEVARRNSCALRSRRLHLQGADRGRTRPRPGERRCARPLDARPEGGMIGGTALQGLARACAAAMPFAVAIAIGAVMLALTGHDPVSVYRLMIEEAFGGERRIAATLTEATPLLLMGLAAAVAFRAGVFNVGAEGCFYVGGIVAAVAGYSLPSWPSLLLIPFALAAASVVGGAWLLAPGLLRARLGVDEVVTTLMLNFIAIDLTSWLVDGPLLARGSANSATPLISAAAELPRLLPPRPCISAFSSASRWSQDMEFGADFQ